MSAKSALPFTSRLFTKGNEANVEIKAQRNSEIDADRSKSAKSDGWAEATEPARSMPLSG